jgi:D-3-phosphoglycerate dehydrogenase / 2-oxoglutarate reductase
MARPRILCMVDLDPYPDVRAFLEENADLVVVPADEAALPELIDGYDAYFGHIHVRVTREVIQNGTQLKAVASPTTGTDHIHIAACVDAGVEVVCIKHDLSLLETFTATAELAWGLLISCVRELPAAHGRATSGHWDRDLFTGHQLAGKTLGILGYGRLGKMVADYGNGFRMRVIANDIKKIESEGVESVDFETLLRESDVLSLHIHLTSETESIIGRDEIAKMKHGAVLINVSRGALVDEAALIEALEDGRLGGAGVDTITDEWSEDLANHPMIRYAANHRNLIVSPHIGGSTYESNHDARMFTVRKLIAYLDKQMSE